MNGKRKRVRETFVTVLTKRGSNPGFYLDVIRRIEWVTDKQSVRVTVERITKRKGGGK
jgi:hypothetical protein